MTVIVACVLVYFFALPLIGGAIAFLSGDLSARFSEPGEPQRISLFNPFYNKSPFDFR